METLADFYICAMELSDILNLAKDFAAEAGAAAHSLQGHLGKVRMKTPKDVVTAADLESERILVSRIREHFPEHSIRTEEAGRVSPGKNLEWILDPVDGTVNFSRGMPLWGVSVALVEKTLDGVKPLVAVVNLPALGKIFSAFRGSGTFVNGQRVSVSATDNLSQAIVSNGDFNVGNWDAVNRQNLVNFQREAECCTRVKCLGSAVVEGTFVAQGSLDAFVMTMSYPWDIAAIALLVEEAGGKVSRLDGEKVRFADGEQLLFSNGILHDSCLKMLKGDLHG